MTPAIRWSPTSSSTTRYALAGSSFARTGWAVEAIDDQLDVLDIFTTTVGRPQRTVTCGDSLGGLLAAQLAERAPDRIDGAVPLCGLLGGGVSLWNSYLDVLFTAKTRPEQRHRARDGRLLNHSRERREVTALYQDAGLSLDIDLRTVADAPRISDSPAALAYMTTVTFDGHLGDAPVLTPPEKVAALLTLIGRLETGTWPATAPAALMARTAALGPELNGHLDDETGPPVPTPPAFTTFPFPSRQPTSR